MAKYTIKGDSYNDILKGALMIAAEEGKMESIGEALKFYSFDKPVVYHDIDEGTIELRIEGYKKFI